MKEPFFILKSIALFVALMWGMSLPCIADKKPIPTIDPIELEGIIEDERERTLLLPVEAWTNRNELNVIFHYAVSNVTITIYGPTGVLANHIVSLYSYQSEVFDISNYPAGTYTLVITTPQGTYLTGVFEVD